MKAFRQLKKRLRKFFQRFFAHVRAEQRQREIFACWLRILQSPQPTKRDLYFGKFLYTKGKRYYETFPESVRVKIEADLQVQTMLRFMLGVNPQHGEKYVRWYAQMILKQIKPSVKIVGEALAVQVDFLTSLGFRNLLDAEKGGLIIQCLSHSPRRVRRVSTYLQHSCDKPCCNELRECLTALNFTAIESYA